MKRYIVSREPDPRKITFLHWYLEGAHGIRLIEIISNDEAIVEMTDDAVAWLGKWHTTFIIQEHTPTVA